MRPRLSYTLQRRVDAYLDGTWRNEHQRYCEQSKAREKADAYFREQCQRLGPIEDAKPPACQDDS